MMMLLSWVLVVIFCAESFGILKMKELGKRSLKLSSTSTAAHPEILSKNGDFSKRKKFFIETHGCQMNLGEFLILARCEVLNRIFSGF